MAPYASNLFTIIYLDDSLYRVGEWVIMVRKADGRRLRGRLLKEARKLGFTRKRRGSFSVSFLQTVIEDLSKPDLTLLERIEALFDAGDQKALIRIRRSIVGNIEPEGTPELLKLTKKHIKSLETTKKSRGTKQRRARYQKERRKRNREKL